MMNAFGKAPIYDRRREAERPEMLEAALRQAHPWLTPEGAVRGAAGHTPRMQRSALASQTSGACSGSPPRRRTDKCRM